MRIDGKAIAEDILRALEAERGTFGPLTLGIVMSEGDKATESFVKIKTRMAERLRVVVKRVAPEDFSDALLCDGVIVQLPLSGADALLAQIPGDKDVDALGPEAQVLPPVGGAVRELLARGGVDVRGTQAVVVGAGRLVGKPVAALLRELGAHVEIVTSSQGSLESLKRADIVVLGAGEPGFIKPEMLKSGVVLIDAGTSESAGKVLGDADPACEQVASLFTPVPGGVGPVAVAMIFKNLFELQKKNSS